ncbi:MAG: hypothetical protein HDQ88_03650 [Clostridia bacterium]|nr:hypothetical protein [Clostridia bacterium]
MKKISEAFDRASPENQAMRLAHRYNALVDAYEELEHKYEELKAATKGAATKSKKGVENVQHSDQDQ